LPQVFGCGNTQWARTYQHIPALIDTTLEELGGRSDPLDFELCAGWRRRERDACALMATAGRRVGTFGTGDADLNLDEAFRLWKRDLMLSLFDSYGLKLPGTG
jgi:hypothetical protein